MNWITKPALACVAAFFCATVSFSQQPALPNQPQPQAAQPPSAQEPQLKDRPAPKPRNFLITEGKIQLDMVVSDAAGKPVTGLQPWDFRLLDNNQPRKILSFRAFNDTTAPDPPVEVILVIDMANLPFEQVSFVRKELDRFLHQNGGHLAQPVSIVLLNETGIRVQPRPSVDGNALADIVSQIKPHISSINSAMGGDGLVERFQVSVHQLAAIAENEARKPGRKLLIWLGPGWPMLNQMEVLNGPGEGDTTRERQRYMEVIVELTNRLREARMVLYSVAPEDSSAESGRFTTLYKTFLKGVASARQADAGNLALKVLVTQTGGQVLGPDNDLVSQVNRCIADANSFYRISFNPPPTTQPDEYHGLQVQAVDKPGLTVRTNSAYYNEPAGITVAQLEHELQQLNGKSDADVAKELSGLELTDRLRTSELSALKEKLHGAKSEAALVALADASVFLDLPPAQAPAIATPSMDEQRRIIALTVDYLGKTISRLPNFMATRTTVRYLDTPPPPGPLVGADAGRSTWRLDGTSAATVVYRDGKEESAPAPEKGSKNNTEDPGLITRGTFGPILSTVIVDAAHSQMTWSRWEQGATGPEAVFHFVVPKANSHYEVAYLSSGGQDEGHPLQQGTGYHGEVAIDPTTGTILRLAVEADPDLGSDILRADVMVEYGTVNIGGKSYTCPVRSVSLSQAMTVILNQAAQGSSASQGYAITRLNDVTFDNYHVFRSTSRILPD